MTENRRCEYINCNIKVFLFLLVFVMIGVSMVGISVPGLTVSSIDGDFHSPTPYYADCVDTGSYWNAGTGYVGWDYVCWGAPYLYDCDPKDERSAYFFQGAGQQTFDSGEIFLIGNFNHRNFPVYRDPINGVDLDVTLNFTNPSKSVEVTFSFEHEETPNSRPCYYQGSTVCPDRVALASSLPDQEFGPIDGKYYKLQIVGFAQCGSPYNAALPFITEEGQENESCIYGRLIVQEPAVSIEKFTNDEDADTPTGPVVPAGDSINWKYRVSNVGNVPLSSIDVTDDMGTPSDGSDDVTVCTVGSLASGADAYCDHTGTAQAGQYSNVAEASVTYGGDTYTDTDPSHYFGREISLDVTGDLSLEIVQKNPGPGQVALRDLTIGNTKKGFPGSITATVISQPDFQVGASYYTVTQENGSREDASGLLILEDQFDNERYSLPFSSSYAGSGSSPGTLVDLTDDFQSCGVACYSADYSLLLDLAKLNLDYEANDSLTFYTTLWLYGSAA